MKKKEKEEKREKRKRKQKLAPLIVRFFRQMNDKLTREGSLVERKVA